MILVLHILALAGCRVEKDTQGAYQFKPLQPTVDELIVMALDPDDADKRREGIAGLSQHPRGLEEKILKVYAIVATNPKEDATVRATAVNALGRGRNAKYLSAIVAALDEDAVTLRWEAAIALDSVVGPEATGPLEKHALADPSMDVRTACAKALRHYQQLSPMESLCQCLGDKEFSVRRQAHASLMQMTGKDMGYDVRDWLFVVRTSEKAKP